MDPGSDQEMYQPLLDTLIPPDTDCTLLLISAQYHYIHTIHYQMVGCVDEGFMILPGE